MEDFGSDAGKERINDQIFPGGELRLEIGSPFWLNKEKEVNKVDFQRRHGKFRNRNVQPGKLEEKE
jgi:hypothetical protein